ncbi:MAG: 4Fe-4S binding protein [Fervidobacterium sp.]|nr:4Fe-4S binding protein [Fervidobacterium sp.]
MTSSRYILSNEANCKYCYKCLRNCPVKAISFKDNYSYVIEEECVICGTCVNICPQKAKNYRKDLERFKILLNKPFVVSVAPSFFGNFSNPFKILGAIKTLGAVHISETAVGAEFVTQEYKKIYDNSNKVFITTSCPVVTKLVEVYFPKFVQNLFPVVSPAIAHAKFLNYLFGDIPKIFIGPCIAKKEELDDFYDAVLTFEELNYLIKTLPMDITNCQEKVPDPPYPQRTRRYPISGGILFSASEDVFRHVVLEGTRNIMEFLEKFEPVDHEKIIVEASACIGGCLNGPTSDNSVSLLEKRRRLERATQIMHNLEPKRNLNAAIYNLVLKKHFTQKYNEPQVPADEVEKILISMGKTSVDKELNCTGCGYETCRDKAKAVYLGKAEKEMCFAYLIEKVSSVSNKVVDESPNAIVIFKDDKILYINASAKELFRYYSNDTILQISERIYNEPERVQELYINGKKMYFYPKTFQLPDESGNVVLFVDITEMVIQRERMDNLKRRTIEKIEEVLNNQMKLAQDIASLLGESIAQTKSHFLEFKKHMGEDNADV